MVVGGSGGTAREAVGEMVCPTALWGDVALACIFHAGRRSWASDAMSFPDTFWKFAIQTHSERLRAILDLGPRLVPKRHERARYVAAPGGLGGRKNTCLLQPAPRWVIIA